MNYPYSDFSQRFKIRIAAVIGSIDQPNIIEIDQIAPNLSGRKVTALDPPHCYES
jgi:hypothetical protein